MLASDPVAASKIESRRMTAMSQRVEIRPVQKGDEDRLVRFHQEARGGLTPPEYWRWKYFDNPAGQTMSVVALDGDRIVGQFGAIPLRVRVMGEEVLAIQCLDTDVLRDYRKGMVFFALERHFRRISRESAPSFEFAFANELSTRLMVKTRSFRIVGQIRKVVKILDPTPYLMRRLRIPAIASMLGTSLAPLTRWRRVDGDATVDTTDLRRFEGNFDEVGASWPMADVTVVRDSAYLNWRYRDCPIVNYRIFTAPRHGRPAGFIVTQRIERAGVSQGAIIDLVAPPHDGNLASGLLREAISYFAEQRVASVFAWLTRSSPLDPWFRRLGFWSRLTPNYLVVRVGTADRTREAALVNECRWHYGLGESDYFWAP